MEGDSSVFPVKASVPLPLREDIKETILHYSQARSSPPQQTMSPYRHSRSLLRIFSMLETICFSLACLLPRLSNTCLYKA